MPFSISAYFNFQVTLPRSALYESILDMSSSFSRRNCISRNWVASNLAQYFQVNLVCSSFRVSNLCVRSFIFSFLAESCYYSFRYFSHMMSVISLLFLQQLHSAMARGYRMVLYRSLGGFLVKTAFVLFNLAKEGAFCKGVFGKKTSPFLRGLIYVGKGDVSPVFLYYQKTTRLLVGVETQEWSSVMELLKVSISLQLGWLDRQVAPSKSVFLEARGLYPSFFCLYNPSKEASFSLVYHQVCRSLRFTKLILTGPSVWTISGQTSNWLISMMAVCSCCSVLLRFFSEVFESWLEAGLRWKGFFLAERLASPQELVAEVYLLSSLRVDGEVSMGHYNYIPHLQSYPVLTLAVLGLSSCFMLSGCIEGCVMIWVYRIIRIHQGRR